MNHHSTEAQCRRILAGLQMRPMNTIEIREQLDIPAPNSRISEIRRKGYKIITKMVKVGDRPRIAQYILT